MKQLTLILCASAAIFAAGWLSALPASATTVGTATIWNGPYDTNNFDGYYGASETGSYNGTAAVNNNDSFTAVGMPLTGTTGNTGNISTTGGITGGTFQYVTAPAISVSHSFYYSNTSNVTYLLTLNVTAPSGWKVQICQDNSGTPNCSTQASGYPCGPGTGGVWLFIDIPSGNTDTAQYCYYQPSQPQAVVRYWTVYTPPTGVSFTAYAAYDSLIQLTDPNNVEADTHTELHAGYIQLLKSVSVLSRNCPPNVRPTYASGVCSGGELLYSIYYQNVISEVTAGGTEISCYNNGMVPYTAPGSLVVTDDGTVATTSSATLGNWATFTSGLSEALSNDEANGPNCGKVSGACGDTTAGTTFVYYTGVPASGGSSTWTKGVTKFAATIGGSNYELWPLGFPCHNGNGYVVFAVYVK